MQEKRRNKSESDLYSDIIYILINHIVIKSITYLDCCLTNEIKKKEMILICMNIEPSENYLGSFF